jgi:hypothetical protein
MPKRTLGASQYEAIVASVRAAEAAFRADHPDKTWTGGWAASKAAFPDESPSFLWIVVSASGIGYANAKPEVVARNRDRISKLLAESGAKDTTPWAGRAAIKQHSQAKRPRARKAKPDPKQTEAA